jgi:hypothetical protein
MRNFPEINRRKTEVFTAENGELKPFFYTGLRTPKRKGIYLDLSIRLKKIHGFLSFSH